jgi:hypothetical protein
MRVHQPGRDHSACTVNVFGAPKLALDVLDVAHGGDAIVLDGNRNARENGGVRHLASAPPPRRAGARDNLRGVDKYYAARHPLSVERGS